MRGKPNKIYVDNGRDFHSEGLRRGCKVHGIKLEHRPIARPHYGGIIERVIGTAMRMIHALPGTTFSNIRDRGNYDADRNAALTLHELEKWIALAICGPYHNEVHGTLLQPPAAKWAAGIAQYDEPPIARKSHSLPDRFPSNYSSQYSAARLRDRSRCVLRQLTLTLDCSERPKRKISNPA